MSAVVPYRQATLIRSETYRATTDAEVAKAPPMAYLIDRKRREILDTARQHGFDAAVAGKLRDPRLGVYGVPRWCHAAWLAGYELGAVEHAIVASEGDNATTGTVVGT